MLSISSGIAPSSGRACATDSPLLCDFPRQSTLTGYLLLFKRLNLVLLSYKSVLHQYCLCSHGFVYIITTRSIRQRKITLPSAHAAFTESNRSLCVVLSGLATITTTCPLFHDASLESTFSEEWWAGFFLFTLTGGGATDCGKNTKYCIL